jgi:uracil-DNA glycosylase family 4
MGLELRYREDTGPVTQVNKYDFQYRSGCQACPLRRAPKIDPYGSDKPMVYILGEAPGKDEIEGGRPFIGISGKLLRKHIPKAWNDDKLLRWNNVLMSRPPGNRTPTPIEMACCRGYLEDDIAEAKPYAIFGFGAVPLAWMGIAEAGITAWAGRYIPVNVRGHACWYFPMVHPSYVNRKNDDNFRESKDRFKSEEEFAFHIHIKNAFELIESKALGDPVVYSTRSMIMEGIETVQRCDRDSANRIVNFIASMYDEEVVGLDYETNAIRPYRSSIIRPKDPEPRILSVSLSGQAGTLAWPIAHREASWAPKDLNYIQDALGRFLEKSKCIKVAHNLAFEHEWTAVFYGKKTIRTLRWGDSMSQAFILDERPNAMSGGPGPQSLDWLTRQYFGFSIKSVNPVDRADLDNAPLREVLPYNGCDAKFHRLLYLKQDERIKRENITAVYKEHMRRVRATVLTAMKGLPVNFDTNKRLWDKYQTKRDAVYKQILELDAAKEFFSSKGYDLRPTSNPDVAFLLDKVLPAKYTKAARDKQGRIPNAAEGTISKVTHPIANLILAYRKHNKALSTYLKPMSEDSQLIFDDGLMHPITRTTNTRTWRTSSDGPNYQNWNKRDEEKREVREQVDPGKGYVVASFDYAGIQARNVAMESRDPGLVKAFRERYDIHSDWTEEIARAEPRWIKEGVKALAADKKLFKAYRNRAKNEFVFPSIFGAQVPSISRSLGIDEAKTKRVQDKFWGRFGGVFDWHEDLFKKYRATGYVTGLSGFRRRAPISPNELINTPIQSDESIIVLDAMSRLSELRRPALQPSMEIHDDLTFIWPEDRVNEYAAIVIGIMLNCPFEWTHIVPLGVEFSVGPNWYKQKAVGEYFTDTWKGVL